MTRVGGIAIAAIFGLFYAYDVWEAVGNLVGLPQVYSALGIESRIPWWLLVVGIVVPVAVYVAAILIGRRRGLASRALILLVGLAVVAGLSFGVLALADALLPPVLPAILGG